MLLLKILLKLPVLAVFLTIFINMVKTNMAFKNINVNTVNVSFPKSLSLTITQKVIPNARFVEKVLLYGTNTILISTLSVMIKSATILLKYLFGYLKQSKNKLGCALLKMLLKVLDFRQKLLFPYFLYIFLHLLQQDKSKKY